MLIFYNLISTFTQLDPKITTLYLNFEVHLRNIDPKITVGACLNSIFYPSLPSHNHGILEFIPRTTYLSVIYKTKLFFNQHNALTT